MPLNLERTSIALNLLVTQPLWWSGDGYRAFCKTVRGPMISTHAGTFRIICKASHNNSPQMRSSKRTVPPSMDAPDTKGGRYDKRCPIEDDTLRKIILAVIIGISFACLLFVILVVLCICRWYRCGVYQSKGAAADRTTTSPASTRHNGNKNAKVGYLRQRRMLMSP